MRFELELDLELELGERARSCEASICQLLSVITQMCFRETTHGHETL